jgi:amino acid permease
MDSNIETKFIEKNIENDSGLQKKNSWLTSSTIAFKAMVGLGIMTNPIYFSQSGWLLGILLTIIICFLLSYNMKLMSDVAEDIEKETKDAQISEFEDVLVYVYEDQRTISIITYVVKIFCFLANYFVVIITCTNLARYIQINVGRLVDNETFRDFSFYAFIIIVLMVFLIVIILEPSQLKVLTELTNRSHQFLALQSYLLHCSIVG